MIVDPPWSVVTMELRGVVCDVDVDDVVDVVDEEVGGVVDEGIEVEGGGVEEVVVVLEEVGGREMLELVLLDTSSLLETGIVGVLLAIGLVLEAAEVADAVGALSVADGAAVDDVGNSEVVLVLFDIVNCLNTSLPGCLYIAMSAKKAPMMMMMMRSEV